MADAPDDLVVRITPDDIDVTGAQLEEFSEQFREAGQRIMMEMTVKELIDALQSGTITINVDDESIGFEE